MCPYQGVRITHKNRTTHRHVKRATAKVGLPASLAARLFLPRKPTNKNFNHRHAQEVQAPLHHIIRPEKKSLAASATAILQGGICICFSIAGTLSDLRPVQIPLILGRKLTPNKETRSAPGQWWDRQDEGGGGLGARTEKGFTSSSSKGLLS